MDYFIHVFKDPPNVDELLACVHPPPASVEGEHSMTMLSPFGM